MGNTEETDVPTPEEVVEGLSQARKDRIIAIFYALAQSDRFNKFVDDNFDISDRIDDEAKTIETIVVEKPVSTAFKLTPNQTIKLMATLKRLGVDNASEGVMEVSRALGDDSVLVMPEGFTLEAKK